MYVLFKMYVLNKEEVGNWLFFSNLSTKYDNRPFYQFYIYAYQNDIHDLIKTHYRIYCADKMPVYWQVLTSFSIYISFIFVSNFVSF